MAEQIDCKKDFMISHNESDLHGPEIALGSPNSQSSNLPIELNGYFDNITVMSLYVRNLYGRVVMVTYIKPTASFHC
jgi:hypothetical protein